jgi:putative tricarboxylic transport membrane protein
MRKTDIVASFFCIFLGFAVMVGAISLRFGTLRHPQSGFFPFLIGAILVVLSVILLIFAFLGRSEEAKAFGELWRPSILIMGLFIYSIVLEFLGYVVATFILSIFILWVLETKTWWKLATISLALSVGTYMLFDVLLGVTLPHGILKGLL